MLERVLSAVNTPGAHILICLGLLVMFSVWSGASTSATAHDVVVFALAVLSRSMGSGNKAEVQAPNTIIRSATSVEHVEPPAEHVKVEAVEPPLQP